MELKLDGGPQINCASFTPDSQFILAGLADNTVQMWSSQSGQVVASLPSPHNVKTLKWNSTRLMVRRKISGLNLVSLRPPRRI